MTQTTYVTSDKENAKIYTANSTTGRMFLHITSKKDTLMGASMHPQESGLDIAEPNECRHDPFIAPAQKIKFNQAVQTPRGTVHGYFTVSPNK